jgi:hypothetical protein
MKYSTLLGLSSVLALSFAVAAPAAAKQSPMVAPVAMSTSQGFDAFTPRPTRNTKFDYSLWDEALDDMVLDMGPSLRRRSQKPQAQVGTRLVRGHDSAYRLEGSRFTFAYVNDSYKEGLTEYRNDLERLGTKYDVASLPRNEQLAYWINLHNVALIEQISDAYPIKRPSRIKVEVNGVKTPLDNAKFISVKGMNLSLKDIRENIVYANWKDDPRVMYGFFRGDIGGPRLSPIAFTGSGVEYMLDQNAEEFVNSLRGFNLGSRSRNVSRLYEETSPFFFPGSEASLISHMQKFARPEVVADLQQSKPIRFDAYDNTVADLSAGNGLGSSALNVNSANARGGGTLSFEAAQLLRELDNKYEILIREGLVGTPNGVVIIEDIETEDLTPDPRYSPLVNDPEE